jgi:lipopolysaccharide/colanic/teichoic acid biosynthesis glycosyltransferase
MLESRSTFIGGRYACEARRSLGVLEVLPGITGLAQVNGVDMSDAIRLAEIDAQYVRTHSFFGDFKLILATLRGQDVASIRWLAIILDNR